MKRVVLLAATAICALTATAAQAEFILNDEVFADLGQTGFGNAPRLLTLQNNPFENGAVTSGPGGATQFLNNITVGPAPAFTVTGTVCTSNVTCTTGLRTGANESSLVNVTSLWNTGANVGVGLDTNQIGPGDLLFSELVLNIYSATGALLGTFGGNDPVLITQAQLAQQQGNGNSVFNLGLTANEQAAFDAIRAAHVGQQLFAGLAAELGCSPLGCDGASNDGADSFLAFRQSAVPVPAPIVGAGLPGLIAGCLGMLGLNWKRRRRAA